MARRWGLRRSEESRVSPRHCEEPLRRSNPDCFCGCNLDCFAALAMTTWGLLGVSRNSYSPCDHQKGANNGSRSQGQERRRARRHARHRAGDCGDAGR
ncbi:hypothetical protein DCG74_17405 [Bradyrhizobium sp. WBAH42]|nr:hypothetical protein [Bradyrhizobium sp. WBAH30]MDD1540714.1 hypothetical protein [Bradyrhizobium sp. WBAH41]MDD1555840.1 hypothetical protein [Bradyrhizobium sp. WBAH23]MDD1563349.1 hypothetical protein [Bradyrhizobium sp. WBAH33]MDD1588148.1 hypothetical protein [Bradyrhizobium sp. WBAH42]NRB86407.1 hypothetical protein [Bradyrhizobium sp. WBAH10]QCJ90154.1 hypothetical protein DAA57_17845 [Bradyrhizobium yuanmingense]